MFKALTNLLHFSQDPLTFTQTINEERNDIATVFLGHKRFHFLYHPDAAEHVLLKNPKNFGKSRLIFDKIIPITGKKGLVQLEGDEWRVFRNHTAEAFRKAALNTYPQTIELYPNEVRAKLDDAIRAKHPIDLSKAFVSYAMQTAVAIFLGCKDDVIAENIAHDFMLLNHLCGEKLRSIISLPSFIKTPSQMSTARLNERLRNHLYELIQKSQETKTGLMSHLINVLPLTKEHSISLIADQLMTFLFAGFETTAISLTFCFYLLAKNQKAQQMVREESLRADTPTILSIDAIRQFPYANAAYKEALRLFPPAWILARETGARDRIGNHAIENNDNIIICIREIHRHKDFWQQPESFLPERFLDNEAKWRSKKCAFIPFGAGLRICSGNQLAMLEAINAIIGLCQAYHFSLVDHDELLLKALVTLNPQMPILVQVDKV